MDVCPEKIALIESRIDRVLTQYRESPKLLHMIRVYLGQAADAAIAACEIPSFFDLDNATGDQLTLLGKRLGWPRCHCVCTVQPSFGFDCPDFSGLPPTGGFCSEGITWQDCGDTGISEICINDDDIYRKFLKARRYQMLALYDPESLTAAIQHLFGETANILSSGNGRVVIAPGRELTGVETSLLQLYPRVLPVALGIRLRFHFEVQTVFGFGDGWGGFCDPWLDETATLATSAGEDILTDSDDFIEVGPVTRDAPWMCAIDVQPYGCA